jgi:hypothetical protein
MRAAALLLAAGLCIPAWAAEPVMIDRVPDEAPVIDPDDPGPFVSWNVLACTKSRCSLEPTSVYYEDKRRNKDKFGIVMIAGLPERASVPAYFNPFRDRAQADDAYGSLGVALDGVPGQHGWRIVPRLSRMATVAAVTVYLEDGTRRQPVTAFPRDWLDDIISTDEFIYWAGDLDGDGKPDLLMSQPPADDEGEQERRTGLHLWLSSVAGEGALVGHVASAQ